MIINPSIKRLILNDQCFMESLVKAFGYTQETDLLKWVIERNISDKNDPRNYGRLFWILHSVKEASGLMQILLKYFRNHNTSAKRFIPDDIQKYLEYLGDEKSNRKF